MRITVSETLKGQLTRPVVPDLLGGQEQGKAKNAMAYV
jgi:hypothetical protein